MKIRSDRADLADAVAWASQATPKRPSMPALAGIRLTAEAETVTVRCFDYEQSMSAVVACDVPNAGECLVSAHLLREILGALRGATVELALDGERLMIECGKSTYRLGVMRLEDYPSLPAFPPSVGKVARDDLAGLIGAVEHAAGHDDAVAILTAIHLDADGLGSLTAGTTDRFRIAMAAVAYDGKPFTANVPAASLGAALKGLSGSLDVGYDSHLLGLTDGSRTVTTRCLSDDYPLIGRLISTHATGDLAVTVDADALAGALRRADIVSERNVALRVAIAEDEIAVTADGESGDAAEYVPCEASAPIEALYNGAFLSAGLLAVGGEVRLTFSAPNKPVLITPTDESRDVRTLVMPRRSTQP